jgi:hypothetical protein
MFDNFNYSALKQTVFNGFAGGILTFGPGFLGTHIVRFLQGKSLHGMDANHPLITCTKVMVVVLPLFYLYREYGREHTAKSFRETAFDLIYFATALAVIKSTDAKVTPLLSLALVLTHLSWKIFATTESGSNLLGLKARQPVFG